MAYNKHMGYKYMTLGEDTKGHDFKAFGDTTSKYIFWDASADTLYVAGDLDITGQCVKGSQFYVTYGPLVPANVAQAFFVAPAGCKLVSAYEVHGTACDTTDTLTIEKCASGEDAGGGDVALAAAWTLNSTVNVPVSKAAVTDGKEILVAGDSLMLKFASGDGTSYAQGCVTCLMEWT